MTNHLTTLGTDLFVSEILIPYLSADDIERIHLTSRFGRESVKNEDYEKKLKNQHWKTIEECWDSGRLRRRYILRDGRKHGEYKSWYDNGNLLVECTCREDKLDGGYKSWYMNGQLCEECTYVEGDLDGEYKSWHDNGQLRAECTYREGKLDGEFKSWCENGHL